MREAIGFSKERGDSINVVNASFSRDELPKEAEVPLWKQPDTISMAKDGARYLGLLLLALIVIFTVIRPAMMQMSPKATAAGRLNQTVQNDVALPAPPSVAEQMAAVGTNDEILRLARENPATVANVVRTWVSKES